MHTPVEIDFHGLRGSDTLRAQILKHLEVLEERFGRISACRVVVKAPTAPHRSGGGCEVAVRLRLPRGREIDIRRVGTADERSADLTVALNNIFKRARQRLRDQARRMRGEIKTHDGSPTASVKSFDANTGFGFLETPDGREIYFHRNSLLNGGLAHLAPGARVTFFEEMGVKGPQASTVRLVGKHALRP